MAELIDSGHLTPLRAKESDRIDEELRAVRKGANGDYALEPLSRVMNKKVHIDSAVRAYEDFGEGRKSAVCFAVDIAHAETLTRAFQRAGHKAEVVHHKIKGSVRSERLAAFDRGELEVLVNVDILTEGWDVERLDLVVMARPTLSPGLFVQMVGRGLRLFPGKQSLLVLDLVGNFATHGSPMNPIVKGRPQPGGGGAGKLKPCPQCLELVAVRERSCPECGYEFPPPEVAEKERKEAARLKMMRELDLGAGKSLKAKILGWTGTPYVSRAGNIMLKLTLKTEYSAVRDFHYYLDIQGSGSDWGQHKARVFWAKYGNRPAPESVVEAASRLGELRVPALARLEKRDGKLWVKSFCSS
jgi:DNA repair protein RadD